MISVAVLSYDRLDFLKHTIRSMVSTADEPLEIIVHDDGSSAPGVREWLTCMVECGGISHLILNPAGHNEGQGIALNRMFTMAKGDIICKCDQDLIFRPGWARAVTDILTESADLGMRPDEPDAVGVLGLFKYYVDPVRHEEMYIETVQQNGVEWDVTRDFVGSFFAMTRAGWEEFGPFEERSAAFAEDAVLKQEITGRAGWCCALTPQDYAENIGFGLGPSTVVVQKPNGDLTSREIKTAPKLVSEVLG